MPQVLLNGADRCSKARLTRRSPRLWLHPYTGNQGGLPSLSGVPDMPEVPSNPCSIYICDLFRADFLALLGTRKNHCSEWTNILPILVEILLVIGKILLSLR